MNRRLAGVFLALFLLWAGATAGASRPNGRAAAATQTVTPKPVEIEASVRPKDSDFPISISASPLPSTIGTNTTVTFTVTYGSTLAMASQPVTLTADWSMGSTAVATRESFDAFRYVPGSATKGPGGVVPTIDVARRKITWRIPSLPPKTINQKVSFALKTPTKSISTLPMTVTVNAAMRTGTVTAPAKPLTFTFNPRLTGPSQPTELAILSVSMRKVEKESVSLLVETSQPTTTTVSWGTGEELGQEVVDTRFANRKVITIGSLSPLTTYYLAVRATTIDGKTITAPDLFTVTTAGSSILEMMNLDNSRLAVSGVTLKNRASFAAGGAPLVPQGKYLNVNLSFRATVPALVYLRFAPTNVLGIATDETPIAPEKVRLLETEIGEVSASVLPPQEPGAYELIVETEDIDGAIMQDVLGTIRVTGRLSVKDPDGKPIEGAEVYVEHFDTLRRVFTYFPSEAFNQRNPGYTDSDGTAGFVFPHGTYKLTARAIGFHPKTETFAFSPTADERYPSVVLEPAPLSAGNWIRYYLATARDTARYLNSTFDDLVRSNRIVSLTLLAQVLGLALVSLLLTAHRWKIAFEDLLLYAQKYRRLLTGGKTAAEAWFTGFLEDRDSGRPIHGATVALVVATGKVAGQALSNFLGEFSLPVPLRADFDLVIRKAGYVSTTVHVAKEEPETGRRLLLLTRELGKALPLPVQVAAVLVSSFWRLFTDSLLFAVGIGTIILIIKLGVLPALPLAVVSGFNVLIWAEHAWHIYMEKPGDLRYNRG